MDAYIRAAVERATGEPADGFDWSESLTTAEDIARLLHRPEGSGSADQVFVTDHVNETTQELYGDLVDLAIEDDRVVIGCELQTVVESPVGSGEYRAAPEVLIYGSPDKVSSRGGSHYGIHEGILSALQEACRPAGSSRVELYRVLAWLREQGMAHALAHPLDGHFLDLSQTLEALSACRFLEVVNGGFSGDSTRRLYRYADIHNRLLRDGSRLGVPAPEGETPSLALRMIERITGGEARFVAPGVVPWGGSDAHLGRYDRVSMRYRPPAGTKGSGVAELLRDMVESPTQELLEESIFEIEGRGNHLFSCLGEVMGLIAGNAWRNRSTFRGPRRMARLVTIGPTLGVRKVLKHRRHQDRLGVQLDQVLAEAEGALETG